MKKITLIFGLMLVVAFGITYSTNYASASTSSSSTKTCTDNATLGSDGHCHCDDGYKKVTEEDADGRPHSCVESAEDGPTCDDLQATYDSMNSEYATAKNKLSYAQTTLTNATAAYQAAAAANPANVKTLGTVKYSSCVNPNDTVGCGGDTSSFTSSSQTSGGSSCTTLSQQCDQLDALLTSTNQAACLIMAQANIFTQAIIGTGPAPTTTTNTGTTTSTTTTSTTTSTTTATTTSTTSTSNPAFVIGLSPSSIKQGESFSVSATVNSTAVSKYSISATKDGVNLGNLVSGVAISTSARPTSISQTFNTSSSIATGTYLIQISNDSNFTQYANAYLTVTSNSSSNSSSSFSSNTSSSNSSSNTTTANSTTSSLAKVIFLSPAANALVRINNHSQIHWGYNAYASGNIELYVQTICSNGSVGCYPSTALIGNNIPVQNVYYDWLVPSTLPSNTWAMLIAKQGTTVLGYSSNFILGN